MGMINAIFADAIETTGCERCEAEPGDPCVDDSRAAHPIGTLHVVRLKAYDVARHDAGLIAHREVVARYPGFKEAV